MEELITEIREDYQIPPYFSNESLLRIISEGMAYLDRLNPGCNVQSDLVYRALVKNYTYYSYHHRIDEFEKNYAGMILTWQMESEVSQ